MTRSSTRLIPILAALQASCGGDRSPADRSSPEAQATVERLRSLPASPLGEGLADGFQSAARGLQPHFPPQAERPTASLFLPALATAPAHVEDVATGVSVDVTLNGAREVRAQPPCFLSAARS